MSKFDEFDLDVQTTSVQAKAGKITLGYPCLASQYLCASAVTQCEATACQASATCDGCSGNTCSACRSYCGSGC